MQKLNRRETGSRNEKMAADFLERLGYEILERNFRCYKGEVDLIARDRGVLVFVEVKYRKDHSSGDPLESIDRQKQKRIADCARVYLVRHGCPEDIPCRFDTVSITERKIRLVRNAFYQER